MAYGVKYRLKADSVKWKDEIILDILEDGYGGGVSNKYIGAGGIVLSKETAGKICGTNLKFTIQADSDFEYLLFADMATRQYMVNLYRGGSLIWVGYLIADEYSEALINTPYDVQLTATDGLGLLKTVDYIPETDFASTVHRVDVIDKILSTINLGLPYRIAYGVTITGGTDNIFYKAYFHDDYFAGWNCYDVLEAILPPDSTITQHNAQWMVRRGEQDSEATHTIYTSTVPLGNYTVTTGAGETALALAPMGGGDVYPIGSATVGMEYAWKSMNFYSELVKRPSFLKNYDFADGLSSWTESTTGFSETYNNGAGSYLRLVGEHDENSEDVPDECVYQSFPYEATTGVDFVFSLKYSITGYEAIIGYGYKLTEFIIKGRVKYTDGTTTYYLDETDGWSTTNKNFEIKAQGNRTKGSISWKDFTIYTKTPPLPSGTMTVYLYAGISETYRTLIDINFTEVVARSMAAEEYEDRQYYPVAMRANGIEEAEVTIIPTDVPDIDNFERTFYNPQFTAAGARIASFTSGSATGTYTNLMINSLYWLHATNRQKLMGSWRGQGLHLNSVITSAVTGGRKYTVQAGSWDLLNDRIDADLLEIPGSATGSTWAIPTATYDSSAEWETGGTRPGYSTTGSGGIISYPNYSGLFLPQATWDTYFEIVNPGTSGEYIRALRDFASTGEITAYNVNSPTGSFWDNMPVASVLNFGAVKVDGTTITITNGVISSTATGGGGEGVTDHGALTGLSDDDHGQYYNQTRGDARYALTGHNHSGVYEPAFSKNTAFNKNFGTTSGTVTEGNDARLSDARTPVSHIHGNISNAGAIGTTANLPIITTTSGVLTTGSFGTAANTFCQGNDGRLSDARTPVSHVHGNISNAGAIGTTANLPIITTTSGVLTAGAFGTGATQFAPGNHTHTDLHTHTNKTLLDSYTQTEANIAAAIAAKHSHSNASFLDYVDQNVSTTGSVHHAALDVTTLEVDTIIDGVLQTGAGANLLPYSNLFENAAWTKYNCTPSDNNAENPFGGNTIKACFLDMTGAGGVCQQTINDTGTGNYTFSVWIKTGTPHTLTLRLISSAESPEGVSKSITTAWQRISVTQNFASANTTKNVRIELGSQDIYIFGAQLEAAAAPTRYINTGAAGASETGVHTYGDLRVNGSIVAADEITAYSDARLKHDIEPTGEALEKVRKIEVVDYKLNQDRSDRKRTGVIAQQIIDIYPQFVEGSEDDYYSVNYPKMVSVAIKAIQELSDKVERLEQILKDNGINN